MKEYGGYIELDTYHLPMLHEGATALNCGRNCLGYLIEARHIRKLLLPYYMCSSVTDLLRKYGVEMQFYHVDERFRPQIGGLEDDCWLYVMNYVGQLTRDELSALKKTYDRVIVDQAQAYFEAPLPGTDTLYTCRKFFGVADGAFLYTDAVAAKEYPVDESFERMHFLLGRFDRTASEFYAEYSANNHLFADEPIKRMSRLTCNLLHGIDYPVVKNRRTENYRLYGELLGGVNQLALGDVAGAFAYPLLLENGAQIRKMLQEIKIYIPLLWPNVLEDVPEDSIEYRYAKHILPLPCDQRYGREDILYIADQISKSIKLEASK